MKNIFFITLLLLGVFIHASQRKLVLMEKQINPLNLQRSCQIEGYTMSHYDNFSIDPSDKGLSQLWSNPKIIADAGNFMLVPQNHILVLRDDCNQEKVASCIRFGIEDNCGLIDQLATDPSCQGKGLAKKLMEEVAFFCGSQDCKSLKLSVYEDNRLAIFFYEKIGFLIV